MADLPYLTILYFTLICLVPKISTISTEKQSLYFTALNKALQCRPRLHRGTVALTPSAVEGYSQVEQH